MELPRGTTALRHKGFVDRFTATSDEADKRRTSPLRIKYGEIAIRVDYILQSDLLRTTESQVIETAGPDHYLLVSGFELN